MNTKAKKSNRPATLQECIDAGNPIYSPASCSITNWTASSQTNPNSESKEI